MKKKRKLVIFLAGLFVIFATSNWWIFRYRRVVSSFSGHLRNERYEETNAMLVAPSEIKSQSDGSLRIVDDAGTETIVPKASLPFMSGGGQASESHSFSMTALQNRPRPGWVKDPVTIYFRYDSGKLRISSVDAWN